jgi:hypothetical protein
MLLLFLYCILFSTGECDLDVKRGDKVNDCCSQCTATSGCSSFTFVSAHGQCYLKTCRNGAMRKDATILLGATSAWIRL